MKATLARAVAGAYAKAVDKNISIETEEFTDTAVVHDPGWTAEAVGNVLDKRCVKYAPAGTCISIRGVGAGQLCHDRSGRRRPGDPGGGTAQDLPEILPGQGRSGTEGGGLRRGAFTLPGGSWKSRAERCA